MRDPKRIPAVLAALQAYWTANPELRLGQIMCNASLEAMVRDSYYLEDEELIVSLAFLAEKS